MRGVRAVREVRGVRAVRGVREVRGVTVSKIEDAMTTKHPTNLRHLQHTYYI